LLVCYKTFVERQEQKGVLDASVLHEVPRQEGDQESKINRDEKWPPGDSGPVRGVQHQGLPHRQGVTRPINHHRCKAQKGGVRISNPRSPKMGTKRQKESFLASPFAWLLFSGLRMKFN
jgi:hypothetical protein